MTPRTIENCFTHAQFILNSESGPLECEGNEIVSTLSKIFNGVSSILNVLFSVNEYVSVNENITTTLVLAEIVQVKNCERDESGDELDIENASQNL